MNEETMDHMSDPDAGIESENTIAELEAEVEALEVAQNEKCANCTLVKELSAKTAELMSKLTTCSSERETCKEHLNKVIGAADELNKDNVQKSQIIENKNHIINDQAEEITRLNAAMEEATALAATNVVDC
jgi:uncharacterized coiled-coil DUF342 family protein